MLIIGTGFPVKVFQTVDTYDWDIDVWGSADPIIGENICIPANGAYDIIVDPKDTKQVLDVEVNDNPIILCSKNRIITTDLAIGYGKVQL